MFPIQIEQPEREYPPQLKEIPWELIALHERQALDNHCGQSLKRLAERHGLSACEAVAILEDKRYMECWRPITTNEQRRLHHLESISRLRELVDQFLKASAP